MALDRKWHPELGAIKNPDGAFGLKDPNHLSGLNTLRENNLKIRNAQMAKSVFNT